MTITTSGRYVLRAGPAWAWQCDLHDDPDERAWGVGYSTQAAAFAAALAHAHTCGHSREEP